MRLLDNLRGAIRITPFIKSLRRYIDLTILPNKDTVFHFRAPKHCIISQRGIDRVLQKFSRIENAYLPSGKRHEHIKILQYSEIPDIDSFLHFSSINNSIDNIHKTPLLSQRFDLVKM